MSEVLRKELSEGTEFLLVDALYDGKIIMRAHE